MPTIHPLSDLELSARFNHGMYISHRPRIGKGQTFWDTGQTEQTPKQRLPKRVQGKTRSGLAGQDNTHRVSNISTHARAYDRLVALSTTDCGPTTAAIPRTATSRPQNSRLRYLPRALRRKNRTMPPRASSTSSKASRTSSKKMKSYCC